MDLRTLSKHLDASGRIDERRKRIERELKTDLGIFRPLPQAVGEADTKNCEQMFGMIGIPLGLAGPLRFQTSDGAQRSVYLPLATTEGALVASVNRGCKAVSACQATTTSTYHGMTRSLAFRIISDAANPLSELQRHEQTWRAVAESTSAHLRVLSYETDTLDDSLFLTLSCDTDEAMGMNMTTIAAQAVGEWVAKNIEGLEFVTVAGNVDSDKKPSTRTHRKGRGYEVTAQTTLRHETVETVLKSSIDVMLQVSRCKLGAGSSVAGAISRNLHAANIVAALYLATGQDAAHVVEGSLTDTTVRKTDEGLHVSVRCPALLVGVRGGGTMLPMQRKCLEILDVFSHEHNAGRMPAPDSLQQSSLHPSRLLAEIVATAVLAGEISLLAAQASHTLARAHQALGRNTNNT